MDYTGYRKMCDYLLEYETPNEKIIEVAPGLY